jgi:hypothetical protein
LEQKVLVWHLDQAAITGRDIYAATSIMTSATLTASKEAAVEIAPAPTAEALRTLATFYRTGQTAWSRSRGRTARSPT